MSVQIFRLNEKDFERVKTGFGNYLVARYFNVPNKNFSSGFFAVENGWPFEWSYWYDEVLYVVKGEGKLSFSAPPLFDKTEVKEISHGNLTVIQKGSKIKFECTSKEPLVFAYAAIL